jgi:hypothetical protein
MSIDECVDYEYWSKRLEADGSQIRDYKICYKTLKNCKYYRHFVSAPVGVCLLQEQPHYADSERRVRPTHKC